MGKLFLCFLLLFSGIKIHAQTIQGKVIDQATGEAIPFVSLMIVGAQTTSITNENGDFVIKATSVPIKLKFSHVSYLTTEIQVNDAAQPVTVKLMQASINLEEVKIDPFQGMRLLQKAFSLANTHQEEAHYLKSFYRQLTTIDNKPSRINEIFYDIDWKVTKTTGWIARQTRFAAVKNNIGFDLSNQSYFTFTASGYLMQPKSGTFVTEKTLSKYTIEIDKYIEQGDQSIAVITCTIKKKSKSECYSNSTFYIGTEDFKIYRVEHNIHNLPITTNANTSLTFPPIVKTIATFKNSSTAINVLECISTKMYFSISYNNTLSRNPIQGVVSSLLTVFQEDASLKNEKFELVSKKTKDKNVVESIKYNADFWRENPIVKQTTLEDKFSKMMEGENAFGTMINP
ncbi:carboxypeptidase-like regulatory domain-containing protein [Pedobacter sp. MW01-1-1]|uniref:carboxypeptidase-like regulatory domain-containing protein n=1 Tax=Pedobacter sp. MW01-1-1 TaxID=3383027 RepID=UPI003FEF9BBC